MTIPEFSSEKEEAAWWDAHRSEIETEICAGMKQQMATEADGLEGSGDQRACRQDDYRGPSPR